uniref:Uncharacterized protein n=1 Tax=Candidozyma auris TaxID=498019 RepID=A0A0L0NPB1_CANAR
MFTRIVSIAVGAYAVYDVAKRHSYTVVLDDDNKLIRSSLWVSIFELCFLFAWTMGSILGSREIIVIVIAFLMPKALLKRFGCDISLEALVLLTEAFRVLGPALWVVTTLRNIYSSREPRIIVKLMSTIFRQKQHLLWLIIPRFVDDCGKVPFLIASGRLVRVLFPVVSRHPVLELYTVGTCA